MEFKKLFLEKKLPSFLGLCFLLFFFRYIPHPPNFTPVIAFGIYIPLIFGFWSIPFFILGYAITDFFIGFHSVLFFTWGTVIFISLISKFFASTILSRLAGGIVGAILFFIITNFGVWTNGSYGYTLSGLMSCYIFALPFFGNTLISTIFYSTIIETVLRFSLIKKLIKFN